MKKIIKHIKIIKILIFTSVLFPGCNKFLDLSPTSSLTPDNFWKTHEDATTWMASIYNQMQRTFQSNLFDWGELRCDHIRNVGTNAQMNVFINNRLQSAAYETCVSWEPLYTTINLSNIGIKHYAEMMAADIDGQADMYREYIAQCYGMRALMYFYGMRVWGRMPLMLEGIEGQAEEKPRASITAMRQQILDDIDMALENIRVLTGAGDQKYYLTRSAMLALKTDVHAWFQEWDDVIGTSDLFMSNSNLNWIAQPEHWKTLFLEPTHTDATENVFVMYFDRNEFGGNITSVVRLGRNGGTSDVGIIATGPFEHLCSRVNYMTTNVEGERVPSARRTDARYWHCFDTLKYKTPTDMTTGGQCRENANNSYQFGKFHPWNPTGAGCAGNGRFDYPSVELCNAKPPIYRYVDIMTLRAEAFAMTGRYEEALEILKKVRTRVGYDPDYETDPTHYMEYYNQFPNKDEIMQEAILLERQLEFLGEGKRWFDLCRVGKTAFSKPYYDVEGSHQVFYPDGRISVPYQGYYAYLKKFMNTSATRTDFEGMDMGRVFFPVFASAIQANVKLRGDQTPPYDE